MSHAANTGSGHGNNDGIICGCNVTTGITKCDYRNLYKCAAALATHSFLLDSEHDRCICRKVLNNYNARTAVTAVRVHSIAAVLAGTTTTTTGVRFAISTTSY